MQSLGARSPSSGWGTPVLFATVAVVGAFLLGQHSGNRRLDDGAEPADVMTPWRPPSGKCRNDYVTIIAEGAASESPPQLSLPQMLWIAQSVRTAKPLGAPGDFLVFGLGYDSAIWAAANCGGMTVFLENMQEWIDQVTKKIPGITVYQATYSTNLDKPAEFLKSPSDPDMPAIVKNSCFDVVLVDSPMGWKAGHPGRFQPVYWSVNMARRCIKEGKKQQVTIFVHDAQRQIEDLLVRTYLMTDDIRQLGNLNGRFGLLRGFLVTAPGALAAAAAREAPKPGNRL